MIYYYLLLTKNICLNLTFRMTKTVDFKSHPIPTLSSDVLNKIISLDGCRINFSNKYYFRRYLIREYTKIITDMGLNESDPPPSKLKYTVHMLINFDVYEIYQNERYVGVDRPWVVIKQIRNSYYPKSGNVLYSYNADIVRVILSRIRDKNRRCLVCGSRKSPQIKSLFCPKHKGFVECEYEGCKAKTVCRGGDKAYCNLHLCVCKRCNIRDTKLVADVSLLGYNDRLCQYHSSECLYQGCDNRVSNTGIEYCCEHNRKCFYCSNRINLRAGVCFKKHSLMCKLDKCNKKYDPVQVYEYSSILGDTLFCREHYSKCLKCGKRIPRYTYGCGCGHGRYRMPPLENSF